jgi:hypothetical protein
MTSDLVEKSDTYARARVLRGGAKANEGNKWIPRYTRAREYGDIPAVPSFAFARVLPPPVWAPIEGFPAAFTPLAPLGLTRWDATGAIPPEPPVPPPFVSTYYRRGRRLVRRVRG